MYVIFFSMFDFELCTHYSVNDLIRFTPILTSSPVHVFTSPAGHQEVTQGPGETLEEGHSTAPSCGHHRRPGPVQRRGVGGLERHPKDPGPIGQDDPNHEGEGLPGLQ